MAQRLNGRTALISGSTSGIGKAIAVAMAAEGAQVIVSGRNRERGQQVVEAIASSGGEATFIAADLDQGSAAVQGLARAAEQVAGNRIDILVNNAAHLLGPTATTETDEALIDIVFATSVKAPLLLTAAIVPRMIAQGSGTIINMGSINGLIGMPGAALYSAAKSAVHGLTRAWSAEYGPAGIRVNTIAPGPTLTETVLPFRQFIQELIDRAPSRQFSTPEQIAAAAVFLASDDAANIHGATLSVDGGFTTV